MDQQAVSACISQMEQEILQLHVKIAVTDAQIADAQTPTGNAPADKALRDAAAVAANTKVVFLRQLSTRAAMLANLQGQMAAFGEQTATGAGSAPGA